MKLKKLVKLVDQLNDRFQGREFSCFHLSSYGYGATINFNDEVLWSSETDGYDDVEQTVKERFDNYVNELQKFKFIKIPVQPEVKDSLVLDPKEKVCNNPMCFCSGNCKSGNSLRNISTTEPIKYNKEND